MSIKLQILMILGSIAFFLIVLHLVKKETMSNDFGTIWILYSIFFLIIAIFPQIFDFISNLLGIMSPYNAVLLIVIFSLLIIVFYLFLRVSKLEKKITFLVEQIAIEDKKKNDK